MFHKQVGKCYAAWVALDMTTFYTNLNLHTYLLSTKMFNNENAQETSQNIITTVLTCTENEGLSA